MTSEWKAVENALADAISIAWDGCHKIYVHMDEEQHNEAEKNGHDPVRITDIAEAMATLRTWYDNSCPLRFISAVCTNHSTQEESYLYLIPQFAEE